MHQETPPSGVAPSCALCAKPIEERYLRDSRGQYFCASHILSPCRFCGRGFDAGRGSRSDRCPSCTRVGVFRPDEAQARYEFVTDWYHSQDLHFAGGPPPLKLQESLAAAPNGRPMLGFADKRFPAFGKVGEVRSIVVQSGLPRFLFGVVTAHELGHAYLVAQGADLSTRMEEGVCDWLAHAFALRIGTDDMQWAARQIETNPDPVNGDGFRRVRALAGKATPRDIPRMLPLLSQQGTA